MEETNEAQAQDLTPVIEAAELNEADKKVCRSCLKVDKQMKNLFKKDSRRLLVMIENCTSIKVSPDDGLPDAMCLECEEKLQAAYDFCLLFKNNDQALRAHLNVKHDEEEDDADMDDDDSVDSEPEPPESADDEGNKGGKFRCHVCNKHFASPRGVSAHRKRFHDADPDYEPDGDEQSDSCITTRKTFRCQHCEMEFARQHLLMKHERDVHMDEMIKTEFKVECHLQEEELEEAAEADKHAKKGLFPCETCGKVLTTIKGLKIHNRRHTGLNLYKCNLCEKTFTKCSHMKRHRLAQHGVATTADDYERPTSSKKEMQCEFCDRKFKYKKSFAQHMQTEHGIEVDEDELAIEAPMAKRHRKEADAKSDAESAESENNDAAASSEAKEKRTFNCQVCQVEFTHASHLSRHMIVHRTLLTHKCDKCDAAFISDELLKNHALKHVDKPYNCAVCNKTFVRGEHYIRHVQTHDFEEDKTLLCPICGHEFEGMDKFSAHIKIHVANDKRHVCTACGKAFNRADNLRTHMKIHTGDKETPKLHLCVYCGKEFNNSSNMIVHMRRHTGERPYKCKQCGKGFPRSHDLKCHERTHSGEKPYLCTLCGKSFNKSNKLLRHTRVHTGERPYVCSICGRAFTQSNDLALHMRRHTGARPYACGVCPARFIQSGQLKAHQRSKGHWVEMPPDLKGSYRVEPVISAGEAKPIRFRRTASGQKYEPPDFSENPPPFALNADQSKTVAESPSAISLGTTNTIMEHSGGAQVEAFAQYADNAFAAGKVQTKSIHVVPVQALKSTATATSFHDDSPGPETNNAFSPAAPTFECTSFS